MSGKYREEEVGWRSCEVRERYKVGLWKVIRKDWDILSGSMAFSMGNGRRLRFWKDKWRGNEPLCTSFPSLFAIALFKEAWVEDVWNHLAKWGVWAALFSRWLNDWEVVSVKRFF